MLDLDIGLPVSELHALLRRQESGEGPAHDAVVLDAVTRRGRPVRVRVTVSASAHDPARRAGPVALVDPTERAQLS